jgi:hypothetical protein
MSATYDQTLMQVITPAERNLRGQKDRRCFSSLPFKANITIRVGIEFASAIKGFFRHDREPNITPLSAPGMQHILIRPPSTAPFNYCYSESPSQRVQR